METKSLFQSKTFWANLLGPLFLLLAGKGVSLDPDTETAIVTIIMAAANVGLRFATRQPVALSAGR